LEKPELARQQASTLHSLQAGRALAALLVVLFHASGSICAMPKYFDTRPFGRIFDFGYAGVDFFFVLSGFLMMHVHRPDLDKPRRLGSYLWKRFTRIYLPYWIVLSVVLPVFLFVPQFGTGQEREWSTIVTSIFLIPHPGSAFVLVVAWTLAFEIFFYLLFAVLILNRRVGACLFAVWIGLILCPYRIEAFPWSFLSSHQHLRFLAGMAVAIVLQRLRLPTSHASADKQGPDFPASKRFNHVWSVAHGVALLGMTLFLTTGLASVYTGLGEHLRVAGYTVGSALAIAGLVQAEWARSLIVPRSLLFLGDASYAIYLVHFPTLSLLAKSAKTLHLDRILPSVVLYLLLVAGAVATSCCFYYWIERPLIAWSRRRALAWRQPHPPATAGQGLGKAA
jgi:peptidoglycan/LPS O-acetylase OafA/YrhL